MQKRLFIAQVAVVAALFVLIASTAAQDSGFVPYQRLVMLAGEQGREDFVGYGDIYSWVEGDSELFRETYYGYNGELAMSPDGTKVVYLSLPEEFVNAYLSGNDPTMGAGPYPTNIWLMDLTISAGDPARFMRIADQVTGLPTDTDADVNAMQWRSMPVWSPDSTQIAWVEVDYIATRFSGRIVIYDTRTGATQIAAHDVSMGFADGGMWGVPRLLGWGNAMASTSYNAGVYPNREDGGFGMVLELFTPTGRIANLPISYFANMQDSLSHIEWVLHRDEWRLALQYPNLGWVVMETTNYTYEQLDNPPFITPITEFGWAGQIVSSDPLQFNWLGTDGGAVDLPSLGMPLTFTPEGVPIWVSAEGPGQLMTFTQGSLQNVLPFVAEGLFMVDAEWTPIVWMTDGRGTAITPQIVP